MDQGIRKGGKGWGKAGKRTEMDGSGQEEGEEREGKARKRQRGEIRARRRWMSMSRWTGMKGIREERDDY